jgi:hypothetical protein
MLWIARLFQGRGRMARLSASIASAILLAGSVGAGPAPAADFIEPVPVGRFRATCEDLGGLCFADACGRDQIEARQACRAQCPSSVVMDVVPAACAVPGAPPAIVLRRRG